LQPPYRLETAYLSSRRWTTILKGLDGVRSRYEHHARAARELAEEYFDSDKVLRRLLQLDH